MKILKVDIQNINSLKCKEPISIDFRDGVFKDVGLYAITGTTGSGKTTILDAITIALYQKVPRLNNSSTKLKDIVSSGASSALAIVTFENNSEIYEASWYIKLMTSKGNLLKTPQIKIALKNITTGIILADKVKEFERQIVKIVQLDYKQFLRSVILAQGDFASFLSAKGTEKAKLLEQITGEEIYKRIGEEIQNKIKGTNTKLKEIKSEINSLDILSEEEKEELNNEKNNIVSSIILLNEQQSDNEIIKKWHVSYNVLITKKDDLNKDLEKLSLLKKEKQKDLEMLALHKKATPFKETINEIKRLEKEIFNKQQLINELNNDLKNTIELIINQSNETTLLNNSLSELEKDFTNWVIKLEEVSKIDVKLENENSNKNSANSNLNEIDLKITNNKTEKIRLKKGFEDKEANLKEVEDYLKNRKTIPIIERKFNEWSTKLSILNRVFESQKNTKNNLEKAIDGTSHITKELIELTTKETVLTEQIFLKENELNNSINFLNKNNLENLQTELTQIFSKGKILRELERISSSYNEKNQQIKKDLTNKELLLEEKQELENNLSDLKSSIKSATTSLMDYELIFSQNLKIQSFEEERKLLKEGESCKVCGSTNHPLIEEYSAIVLSESEEELNKRKIKLENLQTEVQTYNISFTEKIVYLKSLDEKIEILNCEIKELLLQFKNNDSTLDISKLIFIQTSIKKSIEDYKNCEKTIKQFTSKIAEKDSLVKFISEKKDTLHNLKNRISTHTEKQNNSNIQIKELENKKIKKQLEIDSLHDELKTQFAENNIIFPALENINEFIEKQETIIKNFNIKLQAFEKIKNDLSISTTKIENIENTLIENINDKKIVLNKVNLLSEAIKQLTSERIERLPIEISVNAKRLALQENLTKKKEAHRVSTEKLLKLQKDQLDFEAKIITHDSDLKKLEKNLEKEDEILKINLSESDFVSKKQMINSLLSIEVAKGFKETKKIIINENIKLETLKNDFNKSEKELVDRKNFEITLKEVEELLIIIDKNKINYSKREGEIQNIFQKDNAFLERNKTVSTRIERQEEVLKKWTTLMNIIGGNQYALNNYVQRLTLQHLINLANVHLKKLNKRYSLRIKEGENLTKDNFLDFKLTDHFRADEIRDVDTSSGGEKFLISLSLALGLSDLASHNVKIDSLFIDEGFGSLDSNTLETVISALETLQNQGKMIGIISHVESLKERIPTQIKVVKKNNGVSTVEME